MEVFQRCDHVKFGLGVLLLAVGFPAAISLCAPTHTPTTHLAPGHYRPCASRGRQFWACPVQPQRVLIVRVMQAQPQGTLDDWVSPAYDDVPPRMWPVAKRSLMAHVARIEVNLSLND